MAISPQATRRLRRVKVKTPGGRVKIHYLKRKPKSAKCGKCGKALIGIPRERPAVFRNLSFTERRVERPYGGNLCSRCTREVIIKKTNDLKKYPVEVGRVCLKTAGREAGKICAVVDILGNNFVLIDGNVKRRKCNIFHLETLDKTINIKKNESTENIKRELNNLGHEASEKKRATKKPAKEKPAKKRKTSPQTFEKSLNKTPEEKKETSKKKEQTKKEKKKPAKKHKK